MLTALAGVRHARDSQVRHDLEDSYGPAATAEWIAEYEQAVRDREAAKEEKIRRNKLETQRLRKREEKAARTKAKKKAKKEAIAKAAADSSVSDPDDREEL